MIEWQPGKRDAVEQGKRCARKGDQRADATLSAAERNRDACRHHRSHRPQPCRPNERLASHQRGQSLAKGTQGFRRQHPGHAPGRHGRLCRLPPQNGQPRRVEQQHAQMRTQPARIAAWFRAQHKRRDANSSHHEDKVVERIEPRRRAQRIERQPARPAVLQPA